MGCFRIWLTCFLIAMVAWCNSHATTLASLQVDAEETGKQTVTSPLKPGETVKMTGRTMGPILYSVIVADHPATITPEGIHQQVQSTLDRVNGLMSTYIADSDVSKFNNSLSTDFQSVNSETALVVARAIEISQQTGGAFDITVGPAVNLWNFGPNKSEFVVPDEQAIAEVQRLIGYEKIQVRLDPPAIKKTEPKLKIDLSAIAKGYAVDQVAVTLSQIGCKNFMVEIGGEVFTRGFRSNDQKWRIGVERPTHENLISIPSQAFDNIALISNQGMATSGDYRNFNQVDGKRYSHAIDPKTCRPAIHALASACVVASDCMTADALATALMILGSEKGADLGNRMGFEYLLVERDSDFSDTYQETVSVNFPLQATSGSPSESPGENSTTNRPSIWPTFIGAAVVFALVIIGMAVGAIFANKPVQGSCGGLANVTSEDGSSSCAICSKPTSECVERQNSESKPETC